MALVAVPIVVTLYWFISPQSSSERTAFVQVLVLSLGGIGAIGGLYLTRQTLLNTRELEGQRAAEAALQKYLEQMGQLLTKENLRSSEEDADVRTVARAQTLTVLERADPTHKRILLQFLYESHLISRDEPIINLTGANLQGADLQRVNLEGADLEGAILIGANLQDAILPGANLQDANLIEADLLRANLREADLQRAHFQGTNLDKAELKEADLREAKLLGEAKLLRKAKLREADLRGTDLQDADLRGADLFEVKLQEANLRGANLKYATRLCTSSPLVARLTGASLPKSTTSGGLLFLMQSYTNLEKANLQESDLRGANLQGANLKGADFRGAEFNGATGLAQDQIAQAKYIDLPEGVGRPAWWHTNGNE